MKIRVIAETNHDTTLNKVYDVVERLSHQQRSCDGEPQSIWIIDDVGDEYYLYESEFEIVNDFTFKVALTGPDHKPTELTKWYAQLMLVRFDQLPLGVKTYAFGPTPEKAMSELAENIRLAGVEL